MEIFTILFTLAVVWGVGLLFEKYGKPLILGELLAGLIVGPPILGIIGETGVRQGIIGAPIFEWTAGLGTLSTLGIFFLMFYAGLITDPKELGKKLKTFFGVGMLGTLVPLLFGGLVVWYFTNNFWVSIFMGVAVSSTAMAVKVKILDDLGILKSKAGYTMMGASVVDNIFSFVILAVAIKAVTAGVVSTLDIVETMALVAAFFGVILLAGYWVYPKVRKFFAAGGPRGFMFALFVGLLIAGIGSLMGMHLVLGAYLAGLFVREELVGSMFGDLRKSFEILAYGFLGPIFIVSVAFHVTFGVFLTDAIFLAALVLAAIGGKILGAGGGAYLSGLNKKESLVVGMGMNARGVVEIIFGVIALEIGILTDVHISLLVFTAFITTLLAPIGLNYLLKKK